MHLHLGRLNDRWIKQGGTKPLFWQNIELAFELESETEFEFALKGEVEIGVAYELRFQSELVSWIEFEFEKHDLRKVLMGGSTLKNALRGTPGWLFIYGGYPPYGRRYRPHS